MLKNLPTQDTSFNTPAEAKFYDSAQILQWHVLLRIVVSFFILFSTITVQFSDRLTVSFAMLGTNILVGLIGINVLITLLSAFFITRLHDNSFFIWSQVLWDIFFVTALIFVSGGAKSLFTFMYILSVINASILLGRRGTIFCTMLYLGGFIMISTGQYLNFLHPLNLDGTEKASPVPLPELINKSVLNSAAMLIAAWLSSKVTEQAKAINKKLRQKQFDLDEMKALNEHMIQSTNIGFLSLSPKGNIIFGNQAAANILEVNRNSFAGRQFRELFPQLELNQTQGGVPLEIELGEGDAKRFLSFSSSILSNNRGENIGWIITFQDVTEFRRMVEEVKQADKLAAVGKLAAGIAHEIRNPLASMSGSIQLLRSELDLDPVNQNLMDIVVRETDRLNMLITDFLIFARPGKMEPELVDITSILSETLGILHNDPLCKDNVVLDKKMSESLFIQADSDQMRQLFWNLFKNALQAMASGGTLSVTTEPAEQTSGIPQGILIRVADTGGGMDEETRSNIFDPFFTTKEMGAGLGLTTAYRIVENHRGRIWCESKEGIGTTFIVLLPAA